MSVSFFALTGTDPDTADMTLGLENHEFTVSNIDARLIECMIDHISDADDHPAGHLPVAEFLVNVDKALNGTADRRARHFLRMLRALTTTAIDKDANLIAWG